MTVFIIKKCLTVDCPINTSAVGTVKQLSAVLHSNADAFD